VPPDRVHAGMRKTQWRTTTTIKLDHFLCFYQIVTLTKNFCCCGTWYVLVNTPSLFGDSLKDEAHVRSMVHLRRKAQTNDVAYELGCAFRPAFRFRPVVIFRNSGSSAEFPKFRGTHIGIKSFQGKINLLLNSGSGIPDPEFRRHSMPRVTNIQLAD